MAKLAQYIKIKDLEIPIEIKSYKNSKSVKIYFKGNSLNITKPKRLSMTTVLKILKEDEDNLYNKYNVPLSDYSEMEFMLGHKNYILEKLGSIDRS